MTDRELADRLRSMTKLVPCPLCGGTGKRDCGLLVENPIRPCTACLGNGGHLWTETERMDALLEGVAHLLEREVIDGVQV